MKKTQNQSNDSSANDSAAQRARLLKALQQRSISTLEARHDLDVLHPAARVQELRERGWNILTHWDSQETKPGHVHRVARYVLLARGDQ